MGTPFAGFGSVDRVHRPTPLPNWHLSSTGTEGIGAVFEQFDEEASTAAPPRRYRTPPRMPVQSPAVLSLASALPSVSLTPGMSPGFTRLHLAEALETSAPAVSANRPSTPRAQESLRAESATFSPTRCGHEVLHVVLIKESGFVTLGIEVNQLETNSLVGVGLRVESVDDHGLVGRHNAQQTSQASQVLVGDRIIEVNGLQQDTATMLSECKVRQQLTLTIERDLKNADGLEGSPLTTPGEEAVQAMRGAASSPRATRLCPNARVFVPSMCNEPPMGGPPGLEGYSSTAGLPVHSPGLAAASEQKTQVAEVVDAMLRVGAGTAEIADPARRALFP